MDEETVFNDPENLVIATRKAISKMGWLTDSDHAAVELAVNYAAAIERAREEMDVGAFTKLVGWMGPNLLASLKALGGTPAERRAIVGNVAPVNGRLANLRGERAS